MTTTAVCADLHLNNSNFGRMDKHGLSFRTRDFMAAFEFFVDQCVDVVKPQRVVVLGDVYENPHPPNPVRRFLNKMLKRLSKAGIRVEIVVGNHDSCYFSHALQPVEEANFAGVRIHQPASLLVEDDCAMILLPHTLEVERREATHNMVLGEFAAQNAVAVAKARTDGLPVLAFGHFGVYGVHMNDGVLNHNKEDVSLDELASLDADAIFLGHYHMDQPLDVPGAKAMYVGSLERTTFNDTARAKSFVVVETERGRKPAIRRVEYPGARQMLTVSGNAQQIAEEVDRLKADIPQGGAEPIVKIRFSGTMTEYAAFCKSRKGIRDELASAKHVAFEKDVSDPEREAQAEAVRQKIAGKADVGSADILEIFDEWAKAAVADEADRKAILGVAAGVVSAVDDRDKAARGIMPGRTRIHGVKLQNFQMYGVDRNVVEFDPGSGAFFGRSWGRGEDWSVVRDEASAFLSSLADDDRKLISIIGKIDGDENESNGAGKSSILDAIAWAFYEKIVRDFYDKESSKGSSTMTVVRTVNGTPERECYVEVLFSAGKNLYLIRRERRVQSSGDHTGTCLLWCLYSPEGSSESGSMSGKRGADAEEWMSQLVSMDFDTFSNSVMFGQSDADKFIRGTDKVKKDIFIKILGLAVMDEYLKETRARKLLIDKELASLEAQSQALASNAMTKEQQDEAEAKILLLKAESEDKRRRAEALDASIARLREDPVFAERTALDAEMEVFKATISHRREEAARASKSSNDAIVKETLALTGHHKSLKAATDALSDAKSTQLRYHAEVSSFDEAACQKEIRLGSDAKAAKPKRDAEKAALEDRRNAILAADQRYDGLIFGAKARIDKFRASLAKVGSGTETSCPECESTVSRTHIEAKMAAAEADVATLKAERAEAEKPLAGVKAELAEVNKRLANIQEYSDKGDTASRRLVQYEANKKTLEHAKSRSDEAAARQADVQALVNESSARIASLKADVKRHNDDADADTLASSVKLGELNKRMTGDILPRKQAVEGKIIASEKDAKELVAAAGKCDSEAAATVARLEVSRKTAAKVAGIALDADAKRSDQVRLGVVEGGFGLDGIRVQIIEKYIPLLNVYVGEFMDVLSDKMSATVVTDGKRDGKMEIRIGGSSASSPRQLSKGQFAKLKVAMDLAIGMTSLARNENAPDFVCLDEVFAPVDVAGKKAMFDVIAKLQEYFRMVLVISHDPSVQETIKDVIVVNQINDVSTIEKQAHEH